MGAQQIRAFDGAWRDGESPAVTIDYKNSHARRVKDPEGLSENVDGAGPVW
jgi:hypothetical protein